MDSNPILLIHLTPNNQNFFTSLSAALLRGMFCAASEPSLFRLNFYLSRSVFLPFIRKHFDLQRSIQQKINKTKKKARTKQNHTNFREARVMD